MGNPYEKAAQDSADSVMKEFADDINALKTSNLSEIFPNQADRETIDRLIAEVDKATNKNEKINKGRELAAKLTVEGAKAFKNFSKLAAKLV